MAKRQELAQSLQQTFGSKIDELILAHHEVTIIVSADHCFDVLKELKNNPTFGFEMLIDLCGVDYSEYGQAQWKTTAASRTGFSRAVQDTDASKGDQNKRFGVVYHLLSITHNHRLRVRVMLPDNELPMVRSVIEIWSGADWFEREAFDLYGIVFQGHPDLRRLLTDYGFIGHPFRKDFPLIGQVEMRYDPDKKRVVYEPVSIEPRVLVPRVIRHDHRYLKAEEPKDSESDA